MTATNQRSRILDLMDDLAKREPFFAHLILSQEVIQDDEGKVLPVPSMGVDGFRLYFNSKFTASLSDAHLTGVLAHEAMHIALMHPMRIGDRDPERWNVACDAVINPILQRRGYSLPPGGVEVRVAKHETAEEVYDRLEQAEQKGQGGKQQMPKWGMIMDPATGEGRPLTESEAMEIMKKIANAAQLAREAGKMPGDLEAMVESSFQGRRDWRDALRKFLGGGHERTRTWSRPARRYPDVILPGMGAYGPGEIVAVIDTSGSIDEELGKKFVAELAKLTEDMTPEKIHVLCCDTRVQWERTYTGYEQITGVQFKGRGGTDFKPPFQWIKDRGINPKALVYFTDLECHSFPEEPAYPTLWVVWPGGADRAPFGEIIKM